MCISSSIVCSACVEFDAIVWIVSADGKEDDRAESRGVPAWAASRRLAVPGMTWAVFQKVFFHLFGLTSVRQLAQSRLSLFIQHNYRTTKATVLLVQKESP